MDQLHHDPRTKLQIKDALYSYLYGPVYAKFQQRLETIILRNALLGQYSHHSFMYKNILYSCDPAKPPRRANKLVSALHPQMDEYLRDVQEVNEKEMPYVVGFINNVLNSSNNLGDYLHLLPNSAHKPVADLIATCPCRATKLSASEIAEIRNRNAGSIDLMRQRMVLNLLL